MTKSAKNLYEISIINFSDYLDLIHASPNFSSHIFNFLQTNNNHRKTILSFSVVLSLLIDLIMSNPDQEVTETQTVSENADIQSTEENQSTNTEEKIEKSSSAPENQISNEPETTTKITPRRIVMSQDIRYATEQGDRDKLMEKYNNYQVSDTNSCNIRFLTDHRQKKNLLGRNEGIYFIKNVPFALLIHCRGKFQSSFYCQNIQCEHTCKNIH